MPALADAGLAAFRGPAAAAFGFGFAVAFFTLPLFGFGLAAAFFALAVFGFGLAAVFLAAEPEDFLAAVFLAGLTFAGFSGTATVFLTAGAGDFWGAPTGLAGDAAAFGAASGAGFCGSASPKPRIFLISLNMAVTLP
ncbi:MAG: hypothetical protein ACR2OM_02730, partial [Aestuariivirgaceae bacterium]